MSHYDTLGVTKESSDDEIKSAYRKLAKEFHPDLNKSEDASVKFSQINEAYEAINTADKRAMYDRSSSGHNFGGAGGDGYGNVEDLFREMFGMGGSPFGARMNMVRTVGAQISLLNAYNGCELFLNIGDKQISVKVPAGIDSGQKIRINHDGQEIHIMIQVAGDGVYQRAGKDLHMALPVNVFDILAGKEVFVTAIDGTQTGVALNGTMGSDHVIKIDGKGMPLVNNTTQWGDLYVHVQLTMGSIEAHKYEQIRTILNQTEINVEVNSN